MSTDCESITVKFNSKKRGQYSHYIWKQVSIFGDLVQPLRTT